MQFNPATFSAGPASVECALNGKLRVEKKAAGPEASSGPEAQGGDSGGRARISYIALKRSLRRQAVLTFAVVEHAASEAWQSLCHRSKENPSGAVDAHGTNRRRCRFELIAATKRSCHLRADSHFFVSSGTEARGRIGLPSVKAPSCWRRTSRAPSNNERNE